jgi:hypothetical protein
MWREAALNHAKHDRTDKREREIRGNDAQLADESHGKPPWVTSLAALTRKVASRSRKKKSALLLHRRRRTARDHWQRG